jgi:hypothetical protein
MLQEIAARPLSAPPIHLTWDEALALHEQGDDAWSAATALHYLGERALARGDRDRATSLLETARAS